MHIEDKQKPWQDLEALLSEKDVGKLSQFLENMTPSETARTVSRLNEENRLKLLVLLNPDDAAELLLDLPHEQAADLIEHMPVDEATAIVDELPVDEQVDLLGDMDTKDAEAILDHLSPEDAQKAREILHYPENSAGGMMDTDYLAYTEDRTVGDVLNDMQLNSDQYAVYDVQYAYVTGRKGNLLGVLPLRELPLSGAAKTISQLYVSNPVNVDVETPLDDLIQLFDDNPFLGVPVIRDNKLVGVVSRHKVFEAEGERDKDAYLKASGIVGGEELRSMPLLQRSKRRLSWLSVNILLNIVAASVIAFYQETLSSVIALAVFLPIISDMSGCSGNQAVAVSIRELTLGLVKPFELVQVLLKEIGVGIINGTILGILLGVVAFLWKGNPYLGLVVGGALAVNTVVAVCLGGMIPLFLQKIGKDPALASGPILTTVTDMCGFFFALAFATSLLPLIS